jgi:hypothetical protein
MPVQAVALVFTDCDTVQRRLQQVAAAVVEVADVLPVGEGDIAGVAEGVPLIPETAFAGMLSRQPPAAVILKAHLVRLHMVETPAFLRRGEYDRRQLVKAVVAVGARTVRIFTAQQAAQYIPLLPPGADTALCAVHCAILSRLTGI